MCIFVNCEGFLHSVDMPFTNSSYEQAKEIQKNINEINQSAACASKLGNLNDDDALSSFADSDTVCQSPVKKKAQIRLLTENLLNPESYNRISLKQFRSLSVNFNGTV